MNKELIQRIKELPADKLLWLIGEPNKVVANTTDIIHLANELERAETKLGEYADEKNWTSNDYGNQTEFRLCKNGYDNAQAYFEED